MDDLLVRCPGTARELTGSNPESYANRRLNATRVR